jgi:hypothetical protein
LIHTADHAFSRPLTIFIFGDKKITLKKTLKNEL